MAKIIIQGPKEEVKKAKTVLNQTFEFVSEVVNTRTEKEHIAILDVYATAFGKERFSDEEIQKAMACCSNKERDCYSCPFVKEEACINKMQLEASLLVGRLCRAQCKEKSHDQTEL